MAWATSTTEVKELPKEVLLRKETIWYSSYNEPERWKKDLEAVHYKLIGEYEIEKDLVLYRYELDEAFRKELAVNTSHFQTVIINTSLPK